MNKHGTWNQQLQRKKERKEQEKRKKNLHCMADSSE